MLILSGDDVEALLGDTVDLIEPLEAALRLYSSGACSVPPRVAARAPAGLLAAMPAYVPEIALAAKLVSVFPANSLLPTHQGVIGLFDERDGSLLSVMEGRHITARRAAAVSAISVRLLSPTQPRVLAVLGSGEQARAHLELLPTTSSFAQIRLAARSSQRAASLARLIPNCQVMESLEAATRGADVVVCCTDASEPVLERSWLSSGAHVISVGSGAELDPVIVELGHLFVEWRGAATFPPPAGASELQGVEPGRITELGEVLAGIRPGRQSDSELTVFKSTGLGVEDAAVARFVYREARERHLGQSVPW